MDFSLRCDEAFSERVRQAAAHEFAGKDRMTISTFTRSLMTWALAHYEAHGCSLEKLFKEMPDPPPKRR